MAAFIVVFLSTAITWRRVAWAIRPGIVLG